MYFPKTELEELRDKLNNLRNESDEVEDMLTERNIMTRDSFVELSTTYLEAHTSYFDRTPSIENVREVSKAIADTDNLKMDDDDYLDAENPYNTKALTIDDMKELISEIKSEILVE